MSLKAVPPLVEADEESLKRGERIKPPEPGAEFNFVEEVIYRRRSVRAFSKRQVPEYLVQRILETGRYAPSAGNGQPWKFIVIQSRPMIDEMTADVVKFCQRIQRFADYTEPGMEKREWRAKMLQRLSPNNFHPVPLGGMAEIAKGSLGVWHGAPTVIALMADMRAPGKPVLDVGIAGQNMVLAAHSLGIATCWVSFIVPLAFQYRWRKRLGIRYPYKLMTSIALGYPKGNPDQMIQRETNPADWFCEDGTFKVVY